MIRTFYFLFLFISSASLGVAQLQVSDNLTSTAKQGRARAYLQGWSVEVMNIRSLLYHSSFAPSEAIKEESEIYLIDFSPVLLSLNPENQGAFTARLKTLQVDYHTRGWKLSIGHEINYFGNLTYSEELATIATRGNAYYLGERVKVGPAMMYQSYHGLVLGIRKDLDRFSFYGNVKYLSGNEHMATIEDYIVVETDADSYELSLESDYRLKSSSLMTYRGVDDVRFDFDIYQMNPLFSGNHGLAFNLGLNYYPDDRQWLEVEIQDVGRINWNKNIHVYNGQSHNLYSGVDLLDYLSDDNNVTVTDSLYNLLNFNEESVESYQSPIPLQIMARYHYSLSDQMVLTIGGHYLDLQVDHLLSVMGALAINLSDHWSIAGSLTSVGSAINPGLAIGYENEGIIIYGGMENIMGVNNLLSTKSGGIQLGLKYRSF